MKKYTLILLAIISTSASARVTDADVVRDAAWAASQHTSVPQSEIDDQWERYNRPPNEVGGSTKITWDKMPAGSSCGRMLTRNGYSTIATCEGLNPGVKCPRGFKRVADSYKDANRRSVSDVTCVKN
ncbi:Periplasmic nitrate reductase [Moritella viscosa]|uniref:hypothetical protein n=1 Tax=Moritella viscosa TaxID=80854 RepID=UPI00091B2809|nr:hypothetical protein [Moritella viscosa]SHO23828.1 Periplasmic nitrate reductase [Moritella viscosa]